VFVVDTSILVHAALSTSPHHARAAAALSEWRSSDSDWFATWPILYEFLRVVTHAAVVERPLSLADAHRFVDVLLRTPLFRVLVESERHADVLRDVAAECPWVRGTLLHDFHTAVLMREYGVKEIRTADSDFFRFRFLRVVNPLVSDS